MYGGLLAVTTFLPADSRLIRDFVCVLWLRIEDRTARLKLALATKSEIA
jgi:hypothetical protein